MYEFLNIDEILKTNAEATNHQLQQREIQKVQLSKI